MIYQNFDLEIICPQGGNRLCARVLESPQGDCPFIDVKWPFDADTENRLLTDIYGGLRQRHGRSVQASSIQDFGGKLFEAVFSGDIEHLFRSSLDTSCREGKGLRLRLRLPEDSELHMRPWEFLFDTESREFLAVREHTPLVRYLPVAQPIPPITVEGPLRVLVALSSPTDHPRLDIAREWEILCHALEPSIGAGRLVLRRVPGHCTFDNLRDSLRHFGAHIFHFVGHGIPGALVLEQESGKGQEMEATHLRSAFPSGALPRLIVLNACSGAITQDVPFSGLAQGFLRQGVPAVVAMQASITDDAAMIFTRYFYRDLVEIGAVDASLTEARLRMQGNGHPIEWGTPVLYMRALSGQLFRPAPNPVADPEAPATRTETPVKAAAPAPRAEPHLDEPRQKTRTTPARQDAAPPVPETGQGGRKKPRVARVKGNVSPFNPGPDPEHRPAPKPEPKVEPPIAPTVQADEFTVPLPLEPKPAERPVPPIPAATLEPGIDGDKTLLNVQPKPFVPVFTFEPDPECAPQQGPPDAGKTPPSGVPAQAAGPAPGRKRGRVLAIVGVLAAVVGIAISVTFLPSTDSTPEAAPSRPPLTPIKNAPTAPAAPSTVLPDIETAPVASNTAGEDKPDPPAQAQEQPNTSRPIAATTRKDQPRRQSPKAARADICKSAVVSERPASCLFKKQ